MSLAIIIIIIILHNHTDIKAVCINVCLCAVCTAFWCQLLPFAHTHTVKRNKTKRSRTPNVINRFPYCLYFILLLSHRVAYKPFYHLLYVCLWCANAYTLKTIVASESFVHVRVETHTQNYYYYICIFFFFLVLLNVFQEQVEVN